MFFGREKSLKDWSVELGFQGKINDVFFEKLTSVKRVRFRLKVDLVVFLCGFCVCFFLLLFFVYGIFFMFVYVFLMVMCGVAAYRNLCVWAEIEAVAAERRQLFEETVE